MCQNTSMRQSEKRQEWVREIRRERLQGIAEGASIAPRLASSSAEWRRLQRKNLSMLGLLKRKEWPQCHRESSWQERRSRPCQKKKKQSRLSRVPGHGGERVKVGESRTLAREKRIRARARRGKVGLHREGRQIPRRRRRASKKDLPRRCRRKHKQVSGRKGSPGRSAESWFHSKSGQT